MTDRLGKNQLHLLGFLGRAGCALVVASPTSLTLTKRGLLAEASPGGCVHITPAGLRALADAAEAGRVQLAPRLPGASR
jgi:hypothetical protein